MMKVSLCVATLAAVSVVEVRAHSWVQSINGGIQRGGLSKLDDGANTHYYCPTASLSQCQPNANTNIVLTSQNQKPCGGITSPSSPMGNATAGSDLTINWPSNGHKQVTGTCVNVYIAPFKPDPAMSDFTQIGFCLPYGELEATLTLAQNTAAGQYTVFWLWDFGSFFFTSCVDINVAGLSTTTPAPVVIGGTTAVPVATTTTPAPTTKRLRTTTTLVPSTQPTKTPTTNAGAEYQKVGCAGSGVPSNFCSIAYGPGSFCKANQDPCGRQQCDGDTNANLGPCFNNRLL